MKKNLYSIKEILILFILFVLFPSIALSQWGSSVTLGGVNASLNENMGQCLSVSGATIHVVWGDRRPNGRVIYYRRSLDSGVTWNPAVPITDTLGKASFPAVVASGLFVHVVWFDSLLGNRVSYYKRSTDGGNTWGANFLLDSNTKFWPGLGASGSLVVVSLNKEIVSGNSEVFLRRSTNNGTTWDPKVQISNAAGRSEDPAVSAFGSNVYLSWNDNRTGTMQIFYRRSTDMGITWGAETQFTFAVSPNTGYTSMVSAIGNNVDIPYGYNVGGNFDVWFRQSSDAGSTFASAQQLTSGANSDAYPYMIRSGSNLHLAYVQLGSGGGVWYMNSTNGGTNWSSPFFISAGNQPFLANTGCVLHLIWPNAGLIYYKRNPTGNCSNPVGIEPNTNELPSKFSLSQNYPNPFNPSTNIKYQIVNNSFVSLKVYDLLGREVETLVNEKLKPGTYEVDWGGTNFASGVYYYKFVAGDFVETKKMMLVK